MACLCRGFARNALTLVGLLAAVLLQACSATMVLGATGYSWLMGLSGVGAVLIKNSLQKVPSFARTSAPCAVTTPPTCAVAPALSPPLEHRPDSMCGVRHGAGPWEHVIGGAVGFYVGAKVGAMNAATYEVMQYEKRSIAPPPAWERTPAQ